MDYINLTAPCGIACFNCTAYFAKSNKIIKKQISERTGLSYEKSECSGCRNRNGKAFLFEKNIIFPSGKCFLFGNKKGQCKIYLCIEKRKLHNCSECKNYPCDLLQPLADKANKIPHNLKIYNLALIKKMGLKKWIEEKSNKTIKDYLTKKFEE